ncbi:MAG: DDE-type integrase/transposase/recombinase [Deltaproteobacteria bacterium]|nr:DDE-type integrase/transposase/recombinase [Deltaproteobacteria bacterium]
MDDEQRRRAIALFRFGVLGALVSARLEHGDRAELFAAAAKRDYVTPDGRVVRISARTIETWYYSHRRGGLAALMPRGREDSGTSRSMPDAVRDLVLRAKREKPRRSIRRIIRMLERAKVVAPGELSRSSVHRLLAGAGISSRPSRRDDEDGEPIGTRVERRSFLAEHVGDLWVGDALHVHRRVRFPDGFIGKAYLLSQIDSASRYLSHSYISRHEQDVDQEHGLRQALLKYGKPRTYYVDRGPAYTADSLAAICAELSIRLLHTARRDAEAKGVIERWHRTWREEVEDELPREVIALEDLTAVHFAWLAREYHERAHETTGVAPRERFLSEVHELRAAPSPDALAEIFLHRETRTVRKDGTVRWGGAYLEVRADLVGKKVELRFDPRDEAVRPKVYVGNAFVCDTVPLDRVANMHRARRRVTGEPAPQVEPTGIEPLAQMVDEHAQATRVAHLACKSDDDDSNDEEDRS